MVAIAATDEDATAEITAAILFTGRVTRHHVNKRSIF